MLSVIAVNYNSSALLKKCLSSLVSATEDIPAEFIVIDSGSKEEDADNLRTLEGENVRVVFSRETISYSAAINTGVKNTKGDFILITNPDVLYKPDSIKKMLNALVELPKCGAVGPRTWWDEKMTFLLPFSEPVTPGTILRAELMRISGTLREVIKRRWIRKALKCWLSAKPLDQDMISGACIMTTRKIFNIIGGFDETFPLYFEDTDWCLRVQNAGYHMYMLPDSGIIHLYNQSAKQDATASQEKFDYSLNTYLGKHHKNRFYFVKQILGLLKGRQNKMDDLYENKGNLIIAPTFTFKKNSRKLILLSTVDTLIPSAGYIIEGDYFEIPNELWDRLGEGRYFMRAFYLEDLKDCGAWSWVKNGCN